MARSPVGSCGIYCGKCRIYIASMSSDARLKSSLAAELSKTRGRKLGPDDIHCWGCWSNNRNCWGKKCEFRKCAMDKGLDFCYKCLEFPCQGLVEFYDRHPEARDNLTRISKKGFEAFVSEMTGMSADTE